MVSFTDEEIAVTHADVEKRVLAWKDLTKVGIRTTDEGPFMPDVFWGFHAGEEKPVLVFPGGSPGEGELLEAIQKRLPGFDNEQLIEAMGSTSDAFFVIWQAEKQTRPK